MSVNYFQVPPGSEVYKIAIVSPQGTTTVEVKGQDANKTEPSNEKVYSKETYFLPPPSTPYPPCIVSGGYIDWFDVAERRLCVMNDLRLREERLQEDNRNERSIFGIQIAELKKSHELEKAKLYGCIADLQAQMDRARHVLQPTDNTGASTSDVCGDNQKAAEARNVIGGSPYPRL